jgi:hypothetical protein
MSARAANRQQRQDSSGVPVLETTYGAKLKIADDRPPTDISSTGPMR